MQLNAEVHDFDPMTQLSHDEVCDGFSLAQGAYLVTIGEGGRAKGKSTSQPAPTPRKPVLKSKYMKGKKGKKETKGIEEEGRKSKLPKFSFDGRKRT